MPQAFVDGLQLFRIHRILDIVVGRSKEAAFDRAVGIREIAPQVGHAEFWITNYSPMPCRTQGYAACASMKPAARVAKFCARKALAWRSGTGKPYASLLELGRVVKEALAFLEPVLGGMMRVRDAAAAVVAEVPFAECCCGVPRRLQMLRERLRPGVEGHMLTAVVLMPEALIVNAREQPAPRSRTVRRIDIAVRESHTRAA